MTETQALKPSAVKASAFFVATWIILSIFSPFSHAQVGTLADVSQHVTVTTSNERSSLDRDTRMVTSTADVTITNTSTTNISFPIHAVIEILDTDYSNVQMPDALGGLGTTPYDKYYIELTSAMSGTQSLLFESFGRSDCSGDCPGDSDGDGDADGSDLAQIALGNELLPGGSVTFEVKFVRFQDIHFMYNILTYGSLGTGNIRPTAHAGPDQDFTLPVGQATIDVVLDGTASNDPDGTVVSYVWTGTPDPDDASTTAVTLPVGTHIFTLVVTDNDGAQSDPDTVTITIGETPNNPPVAHAGTDQDFTLPPGQTTMDVVLDGTASNDPDGTIVSYVWIGTPDPDDVSMPTVTLPIGSHTFTLVVTDNDGAQSDPDTVVIAIEETPNRPPVADAGGPYFGIVGQSIGFDGTGSSDPDNDPMNFEWNFGDISTGTGETPGHIYTSAGTYTAVLTVNDGRGGMDADEAQVTITMGNRPPSLEVMDSQEIMEGQTLTFPIVASDPDNDTLSLSSGLLPSGAAFDPSAVPNIHTFLWTPTYEQSSPEPYNIEFNASDGELTVSMSTQITVMDVNRAPAIQAIPIQNISEAEALTFQVTATDPDGDDLTFSADNLPEGASFDAANRSFTWTPDYDQAGSYTVHLTATDTGNQSDTTDVIINVANLNRGPALVPLSDRTIPETKTLTFRVTGSDPDGDALTYEAHNLQPDALFDAALQTFSWTPASGYAGTYEVAFSVTDGSLSDSASVKIFVTTYDENNSPSLIPVDPQAIDEGQLLMFQVSGSDPNGDNLTFEASGLPDGASFVATQDPNVYDFTWTPGYDQAGPYLVNFTATDPGGLTDTINVEITVHNVNRPPSLDPLPDRHISETKTLTFQATGSDPDDDELIFYAENLPEGASFGTEIPVFSWTPTEEQAGVYTVDIFVSDGDLTDSLPVQITVLDYNTAEAPVLTPVPDQQVVENQTLTFDLTATDPNGDTLEYSQPALPSSGALFSDHGDGTATLTWTPDFDGAGSYIINFVVSDGTLSDTIDVLITVLDVNREPVLDPIENQSVPENETLTFQLTGSDPDDDTLIFGATGIPQGSTLDPETAVFTWQPTYDQAGDYDVTFFVSDGELSAEQQISIAVENVNRAPSIITATLPNGRVDQAYQALIEAQDPDGDLLQYSVYDATAPVTIDPDTGQLTWDRPSISDIGTYNLSVRVEDPSGDFATRAYTLAIPDRIPPAITLNVPIQANPGAIVSVVAIASDNDAVSAIEIAGSRTDYPEPYADSVTQPMDITLPSEIGTHTFHATTWDPSGNTAVATAAIEVIAAFDNEGPTITLFAPLQATQGQVIRLTTSVSDDVGVSTVNFFADGAAIGSSPGLQPYMGYQIPADAPAVIRFSATAVDFSGNSGDSNPVDTSIVDPGQEDTAPPETDLTTPETVGEDDPIPVTVDIPNEDCLAQIDVYVNHTLAATYFAPDPGTFDIPMPDGIDAGMEVLLEVVVTDCSGNQTTTSEWLDIDMPGSGVVAGEVYDDTTGLPLEGAEVTFMADDGSTLSLATDDRGQYSFSARAGTGRLIIAMTDYSTVERSGLIVFESEGLEVYDARLTPLSDPEITVPATTGAGVETPYSLVSAGFVPVLENAGIDPSSIAAADMGLDIPAGALTQNTSLRFTQISPQGLQGMLPPGWSPIGAADIHPHAVILQTPAAINIPNPLGFDSSSGITLVVWDETAHAWRVISIADVSADSTTISGQVSSFGQFAWVLPDISPQAPPAPVAGELLAGVSPLLIPDPVTTTISPEPQIIFYRPGVHSDVGVSISELPAPVPSGTPLLINLAEEYNFYSGNRIVSAPYEQDIILYSLNRSELTAGFPVTPSYTFEPLTLEQGVIDVDALAPTDMDRGLSIVAPEGGTVTLPTGEAIFLPEESSDGIVPITLEALAEDDLGIEMSPGLSFLGGVIASFSGHELEAPAVLSIPVPAGLTEQDQVLLLRLMEIDGVTRLVFAGLGEIQGPSLVSLSSLPGLDEPPLEGILTGGRYIFVRTTTAIGFSYGKIFDTQGGSLEGALVTVDDMPFVTVSGADGDYVLAVNADMFSLTALDLETMDSGSSTGYISMADEAVELDVFMMANPPYVVSFSPTDGQTNVPLETGIRLTFSEPLDVTTATAANLILTGPEGPVSGTLTLSSGNRQVDFRPTNPLTGNTLYTFTAFSGISDLAGYNLEGIFVLSFTTLDTTPPPPPPAGNITATIPVDTGSTTVTASQGTAGSHDTVSIINKTQEISTPVLVEADGSFSATVAADIMDEVVISITDPAGNETEVNLGRFRNSAGHGVIGPEGGQLESDNDIILDIPAGAFPDGAVVRIAGITEEDIGTSPGPDFPFVAAFEVECSVKPEIYLNASAPLPANAGPESTGIVANVVTAFGKPGLSIVDTAKVIDGRLATSSPPCPGILSKYDRYAMYLNEHEQMRLGMAILSMSPPATRRVVLQPYILPSFFVPIVVHPGIQFDETYFPSYEFFNMIYEGKPTRGVMAVAEHPYYCLPVPADVPLKVVVRDADTGEVLQDIDIPETGAGDSLDITDELLAFEDTNPPDVVMTEWSPEPPHILDPGKLIAFRFSEPVQANGDNPVHLIDEESQEIINGEIELLANNRVIVFLPEQTPALGKSYRVMITGVEDLSGNAYEDPPGEEMTFSVFMPHIISTLDKDQVAAGLDTPSDSLTVDSDGYSMVFTFGLKELDFITKRPSETGTGLWKTHLSAVRRDRGHGPALLTIDASDPLEPFAVGGGGTLHNSHFGEIEVFDDLHLEPRDSDYADPEFWRTRQLHYVVDNPSIRICGDPGSQEIADWRALYCQEEGDCEIITGGCGDLAVATVTQSTDYAWLNLYDVTDLSNPRWISFRALSENRGAATSYSQDMWWAPAGMGFAEGFSVLQHIDITHKRPILIPGWFGDDTMTHEDTIGAYVAVENIGIELVDIGLNFPPLNEQNERLYPDNPGLNIEHYESLGLNSHLYYRDIEVIGDKVVAVSGDELDGTNIRFLEVFNLDLSGPVYPPLQIPYHIPERLKSTSGYLPIDLDGNGQMDPHDIIFTTGAYGGVTVFLMHREDIPPEIVGFYRTPFDVRTRHVEVDSENKIAYVGAQWKEGENTIEGILVLDIRNPSGGPFDADDDEWDDRIIGKIKITGTTEIPVGTVGGFRYDSERRLIYAGIQSLEACLVIIKTCNCPGIVIPDAGSASISLDSGSVTVAGDEKAFESDDGTTGNLFVHAIPSQGGQVCANLDVEITPGLDIRYQITEQPITEDPADAMLDLSGGADTGVIDPSNPDICLNLIPSEEMPIGSYVFLDIHDTDGNFIDRLLLTLTPANISAENVRLNTLVDRINGDFCGGSAPLRFYLSHEAEVTIRVDGNVIDQTIAGENRSMQDVFLPPGMNQVTILKDMVRNPGEHDFEITAVFNRQDPNIQVPISGKIVHDIVINENLPIGHSSVKGIDLMDGHLSMVRKDFEIKGLGPDLQFARSYGSVGNRSSGPIGAGWSHNYESRLVFDPCGHVTVVGGEGSGTRFFNPVPDVDDQGQPILRYQPQAGYHGTLNYYQTDDEYDYYTKSRTRYHYEQEPEPTALCNYTLRFIEDSFGNRLTLEYDPNSPYKLIAVRDASGRTLEFTYDSFGTVPESRIVQITGPLGLEVSFDYDVYGNLTRATRGIRSESYEYSTDHPRDKHNMTRITDPNGNRTEYLYYSDQNPFSGFPGEFDWDTHVLVFPEKYEFVRSVIEGAGSPEQETTQFSYNYANHQETVLTTVVDAWNVTTLHTMNPRGGAIEKRVYMAGGDNISRTRWAYEEGINDVYMTESIEPNGRITRFSYDAIGNLTGQTIDLSGMTGYEPVFDEDQAITQITNSSIFDQKFNKPVQSVDSMGNITDYVLDPENGAVLSKTTYPETGESITFAFTYYPNGLIETTIDGRGHVTRFTEYDAHGNNTRMVDPLGNETSMVYDARSRLIESSDSMGHRSVTQYDELDNIASVTRFSGSASSDRTITYTYYPNGKKQTQTDGLNHTTEYSYDALNRLVHKIDHLEDPDGNPLSYEWAYNIDPVSKTTVKTGPRGVSTTSHMDELHRLKEVSVQGPFGPQQVLSRFEYDPVGNKISETALTGAVTTYDYDGLYRMVRKTLPISDDNQTYTELFAYDLSGNKLSETNANGNQIQYEYDDTYRLISYMDALGNTVRYGYDDNGNMIENIRETLGLLTLSEYDPLNRLTVQTQTFTDPITQTEINYVSQTQYNDADHTQTITDAAGKQAQDVFDGLDQLVSKIIDPAGLSLTTEFVYDGNGNITSTTDPEGMVFESTYDGLNRVIYSRYLPQDFEEIFRYDGAGLLIEHTDKRGIVTEYTYDNLGRRRHMLLHETITEPGNILTLREYIYEDQSPQGPRMIEIDAMGNPLTHVYDLMGREVRTIDPLGNAIQQEYDGINRIAGIDQRGIRTQYEFDALNRLTRVIDPNGAFTETQYLDNLNQALVIDKKGVQTRYQNDPLDRLRQVRASLASETAFDIVTETKTYREDGLFSESVDANGNVTRYEYDNAGRLVTQIAAFGSADETSTTWTYDGAGRTLTVKQGRVHGADHDMTYVYDDTNQRVSAVDAEGNETLTTVDGAKNILSIRNPNGNQELRTYDEMGQLLTITDALGNVTRYTYDDNRNLVMQENANINRVTYEFDANDRLTDIFQVVDVNTSRHTRNSYDAAGNLLETIDPKGQHTAFEYDELNLLAAKTYSNHVDPIYPHILRIEYDYDLNDNTIEVREIKKIADTGDPAQDERVEITAMQYDNLNRLEEIHNNDGKTIQYGYDSNGNRTSLTGPDSLVTEYVFDAMNRLIRTDAAEGSTIHTYHPDGLPLQTLYPNGVRTENDYDNAGRFTEIRHVGEDAGPDGIPGTADDEEIILFRLAYTYDGNGNPLTQTFEGEGTPSETTGFTYDITDRMTQVDYPNGGIVDYTYDAVGNRLTEMGTDPVDGIAPVNRTYGYDTLEQLIQVSDLADPSGNIDLAYDSNGNLIHKTTDSGSVDFVFDIRDQLASTNDMINGGDIRFDYDYEGLRTKKISTAGETRYLYDGASVLTEYDGAPGFTTLRQYTYGRGLLSLTDHTVPAVDPAHTQFYLTDALGSTIGMANTGGGTQKSYKYDAWGNVLSQEGNSSNARTFTGHFFDAETGMYYFGARYYDSRLGRFISQDPSMGDTDSPMSLHRYLYANANPMRYIDLDGYRSVSFYDCWTKHASGVISGINQAGQEMLTETGAMVADAGMGAIKMFLLSPKQRRMVDKSPYLSRARSHIGRQIQDGVPLEQIVIESVEGIVMTPIKFVGSLTNTNISPEERGKLLFGTVASVASIYGGVTKAIRIGKAVGKTVRATSHGLKAGYQAMKLMSRKRVGKRFDPGEGDYVEVTGDFVFKDAYTLSKAAVKAGKMEITGGLTEYVDFGTSARNLLSNLKASFKGKKSQRTAQYDIIKGKLPGDIDMNLGGKNIPKIMTDSKWARELNRKLTVETMDPTPTHGVTGVNFPPELLGKNIRGFETFNKAIMDKVRLNPKLLDGDMVKAGPYLEQGVFVTKAEAKMLGGSVKKPGRHAVIVKHGKVVFRKPQQVIYYKRAPQIPLGWLDRLDSMMGSSHIPLGYRLWVPRTARGTSSGLSDEE